MSETYGGWLGLLKWSLQQQDDGTVPSDVSAMSDEDKAFLEQVMKEVNVQKRYYALVCSPTNQQINPTLTYYPPLKPRV